MTLATSPPLFDRLAQLADPFRGRVLLMLEEQELSVSELCAVLQQPQSTVSRHLKVLSDGGWLGSWRDGTSNLYRLAAGQLDAEAGDLWRLVRRQVAALPAARQDRARRDAVLRARRAARRSSSPPRPASGTACAASSSARPPRACRSSACSIPPRRSATSAAAPAPPPSCWRRSSRG